MSSDWPPESSQGTARAPVSLTTRRAVSAIRPRRPQIYADRPNSWQSVKTAVWGKTADFRCTEGGADEMTSQGDERESLLTPGEVAALFRVDPKTVTRWAKAGKLTAIRTLGGHRRYRSAEVHRLLAGES